MREQFLELQQDIESKAWEEEGEASEENPEAKVPNLDAFQELMNICKAVQNLQENLESLTLQADGGCADSSERDTPSFALNPEEGAKEDDSGKKLTALRAQIQMKLAEETKLQGILQTYQAQELNLKRALKHSKEAQKQMACEIRKLTHHQTQLEAARGKLFKRKKAI